MQVLSQASQNQYLCCVCTWMCMWVSHTLSELQIEPPVSRQCRTQLAMWNQHWMLWHRYHILMHRGELGQAQKGGEFGKSAKSSSPEAPNTSCSCENGSPNPPASLEEEGTFFLETPLHRACEHGVTSSLWTAAGVQVSTELCYF